MSALLRIKVMLDSFLTYLLSYFHSPTLLAVGFTDQPPQPQPPAPLDIESGVDAPPTDVQLQINGVPMRDQMRDRLLALPLSICSAVYPSIPQTELLVSHPLRYSPLLAAVCLSVFSATLSLSLVRCSTIIPRCHGGRIRWIEVAVASSVFAYLLRILLLLPGESLVPVAVLLSFGIGLGAVYVCLNPSAQRHPNSSPETNV